MFDYETFNKTSPEMSTDDSPVDETVSTTTIMMTTDMVYEPVQNQEEIMWKIISLVFIVLTAILLVLTVFLWRVLPSFKPAPQERSSGSIQPRLSEGVV